MMTLMGRASALETMKAIMIRTLRVRTGLGGDVGWVFGRQT